MSDGLVDVSDASVGAMPLNGVTAGALLRAAREAQGLHIAALAVSLKVPVKKIEALEADRFESLPDAVFVRALASSVCRVLKVNPASILEKLPPTTAPRLDHTQPKSNTPFRASSDGPAPNLIGQLSKPIVLAVLALLLGAVALFFLPNLPQRFSSLSTVLDTASNPVGSNVPSASTEQAVGTQLTGDVAGATNAKPNDSALSSAADVAATSLVSSTKLAGVSSPQTSVDGLVVFKATGETWVEVSDNTGRVTLRRLLQAGDTAASNAAPPLRVTVGRADQTTITVRGKAYDLAGKVRDNVAKFEVK